MTTVQMPFGMAIMNMLAAHPVAALRGFRDVRYEVDAFLDAQESYLVARARTSGATFDEIGRALGISDSAAHRRYGTTPAAK